MPKNCKSRKRRKTKVPVYRHPKLFCPKTMVRFDGSPNEYSTAWVCKMCTRCILSEEAVKNHIKICKEVTLQPVVIKKEEEDVCYICDICNKVFSRAVALKKHKQDHEKSNSDKEFGFAVDSSKKKKKKRCSIKVENISDEDD